MSKKVTLDKIAYERHPVSQERKKELNAQGFKILDISFKPKTKNNAGEGLGTDSGDQFSDEQLREAIEKATGKPAHPSMKRENLIARFNKLNAHQEGA